ncbi:RDH12 [Branchiostoma lanceolatum]|uniref:RDH12 protein n=1 Tax=Branchiostoma lanceolatum TaxID=7740 RepID=A0A8J9ZWS2_BRALA|nr:RDH12 [Branchiostoma lanceolatum]
MTLSTRKAQNRLCTSLRDPLAWVCNSWITVWGKYIEWNSQERKWGSCCRQRAELVVRYSALQSPSPVICRHDNMASDPLAGPSGGNKEDEDQLRGDVMDWMSSHQILILSAVGTGVAFYAARKYFGGGVCYSKARLDGKTAIVTGSNTGLGKETARDLARRGARVILACRDVTKAEAAAEDIRKTTGNGNVVVLKLDLSSLASVREFAAGINEREDRLDILINNAGIMMCPQWKTKDGFEMQFGTNHLGHFLLTNLLLDLLKKSGPGSRVVTVSSTGHRWGEIHFDDINLEKGYEPMKAYGQSKLANILFIRELAKRLEGTGVTCYAVHPGGVRSDLSRYMPEAHGRWLALVQPIVQLAMYVIGKSPEQGAQTSLHCALQEGLESKSGLYFSDCAPIDPSPAGQDDEVAKRLWEVSEEMVGLKQ